MHHLFLPFVLAISMRAREQVAFRKRLGRNLRAARTALGLSQRDLAERAEIAEKYVSRVEVGAVTPSVLVAFRLARAVSVSIDELVDQDRAEGDMRLRAVLASIEKRGAEDLERAVRVLGALAAGP